MPRSAVDEQVGGKSASENRQTRSLAVRSKKRELETPDLLVNPLTKRVWVAALGRYGPPALINPWNAYDGDYSDDSLVHCGLSIRRDWLGKANDYLTPHALGRLARDCKDKKIQALWKHIEALLPGEGKCVDGDWADE
jgi:hypothetical protein